MSWPEGAPFAVSITVDVDGEHGLPYGGSGWERRLTARSERAYGIVRGLPRVLDALARADLRGTFYVPGAVAGEHPEAIGAIAEGGHEIGHHGHRHLRPDQTDESAQLEELAAGIEALRAAAVPAPAGYRAPGWELTPATLRGLGDHGFTHDSSLMGDDRPYRVGAGARELWELPVHWSLDDAPHFAAGGDAESLLRIWRAELGMARAEGRHISFTLHPEILGRPHRAFVLERIVDDARSAGAWAAPHAGVVEHLTALQR